MFNLYAVFKSLQAPKTRQAGKVIFVDGDVATIELPGGGIIRALGQAEVDQEVFVRDGVIEGLAGDLLRVDQEV